METATELIARIPYSKGEAIEYYTDRLIFNHKEIFYNDITGYGYSLTSYSHSINLIPTYNSKTVTLSISVGDDTRPIVFSKKVAMPSAFHSKEQSDLDIIFSEIIKITDTLLAQPVFTKLYHRINSGEQLSIGGLAIEKDSVRRKGMFKEKELEQYNRTYTHAGRIIVEDGNGRQFFSTSIGNINAPLLESVLDAFFKD